MGLYDLVSSAWLNQKRQANEWREGEALKGALAAITSVMRANQVTTVRRMTWKHLRMNVGVMFAMVMVFLLLHLIMVILCGLVQIFGYEISQPTVFQTMQWVILIEVAMWGSVLRYFFKNSSEECFYSRLSQIDNQGLENIQHWKEQWSLLEFMWTSIKRNLR